MGARKIFLLNGHGGNDIPCKAAQRQLKSEFAALADLYIVYATYWNLAAAEFEKIRSSPVGGMGHACEMETSVMLAKYPHWWPSRKPIPMDPDLTWAIEAMTCFIRFRFR